MSTDLKTSKGTSVAVNTVTALRKVKLNAYKREVLEDIALKAVKVSTEKFFGKRVEKNQANIEKIFIPAFLKKFPQDEMAILEKYECAKVRDVLRVYIHFDGDTYGNHIDVNVGKDFSYLSPSDWSHFDQRPSRGEEGRYAGDAKFLASGAPAYKALYESKAIRLEMRQYANERIGAYKSLIASSRNLGEVVDIWPEAMTALDSGAFAGEGFRPPVGPEAIKVIHDDIAYRNAG